MTRHDLVAGLRRSAAAAIAIVVLLKASPPALAEVIPEVEVVSGAVYPLGEQRYSDRYSPGLKLGLRGLAVVRSDGAEGPLTLAAELALDGMELDWEYLELEMYRARALVGARVQYRISSSVQVFGRTLAGVDYYRSSEIRYQSPGEPVSLGTFQDSGTALALEVGLGVQVSLGRFRLGAQCGLPVAFYGYDRGSAPSRGVVLGGGVPEGVPSPASPLAFISTTTYDLDALLTLGLVF